MSERTERLLKRICLVLAAVLIYPVVRIASRDDGLSALPGGSQTPFADYATGVGSNAVRAAGTPVRASRPELPGPILRQVETITQSEILGPVVRPQPVALMGIAGNEVFLRSLNGRTGLLRVGETVDGVKLIRVGTNRVLIEEQGKQRELTIFSGLGSQTLIPQNKDKTP